MLQRIAKKGVGMEGMKAATAHRELREDPLRRRHVNRLEGNVGASHEAIWSINILGEVDSKCKSPRVGAHLACLRNSTRSVLLGQSQERIGDEVGGSRAS
jgi:hypothetical protein